jgi:mannosyltransferase
MGLFNLLALLLLAAHGVTVWTAHTRQRHASTTAGPASSAPAEGTATPTPAPAMSLSRWLAAAGAGAAVLSPLMVAGWLQSRQISWLARPGPRAVTNLVVSFAGSNALLPLMVLLIAAGVIATLADRPWAALDVVTVAVPWLVLPPAILLAVSQIHPVYDARYVVYCLPALALLAAAGLAGVARLAMAIPMGYAVGIVAWLPAGLIVVLLAALVLGPQRSARLASSRPDNLRLAAAIVAAHGRSGDAVLYLPSRKRVFSMAYPAPFRRLRDVALAKSPVAAASLVGTEVRAATLRARFGTVDRVWVVSGRGMRVFRHPATALEKTEIALLKPFRLVQRWYAGQAMLSLYRRG